MLKGVGPFSKVNKDAPFENISDEPHSLSNNEISRLKLVSRLPILIINLTKQYGRKKNYFNFLSYKMRNTTHITIFMFLLKSFRASGTLAAQWHFGVGEEGELLNGGRNGALLNRGEVWHPSGRGFWHSRVGGGGGINNILRKAENLFSGD